MYEQEHEPLAFVSALFNTTQRRWSVIEKEAFVSPDANNLRLRNCIVGHCGIGGHLSFERIKRRISQYFLSESFEEEVNSLCGSSLHCRVNDQPFTPRTLGEAVHASVPNQVLHYDFLCIQKKLKSTSQPFEYFLVAKDDFSGFIELIPATDADRPMVGDAFVQWYSRFGMLLMHVSDQGSHFKNKVIKKFNYILEISHHMTKAYSFWANGTVGKVSNDIQKIRSGLDAISPLSLVYDPDANKIRDCPMPVPYACMVLRSLLDSK